MSIPSNQKQWEKFASKDPFFYVDTEFENPDQFWKKGEDNFQEYIFPLLQKYKISTGVGVDFGCGIGRHTFPLAKYFETVMGVDVSNGMLEQARIIAKDRKVRNIQFIQNDAFFDSNELVDFIYCANVFQHIEDIEQIELILTQMSRLLRGYTYIQFDTRPRTWLYHLKRRMPDFLLPRSQRSGIRRIRRDAEELRSLIKMMGYSIVEEHQPNSEYHYFLLENHT